MHIDIQTLQTPGFADRPMFHPKAGRAPDGTLLMALQIIGGSDYYGPVEYSRSADEGRSWSRPQDELTISDEVPGLPALQYHGRKFAAADPEQKQVMFNFVQITELLDDAPSFQKLPFGAR